MPNAAQASDGQFSLEDLVALNEEIAALVRAGVPLEIGLKDLAGGLPRSLGKLTDDLAGRLSEGVPLNDALALESDRLPRTYRAVIEAGLRTGRLPDALESLTKFARTLLEIRLRLSLAMLYPGVVMLVAYGLFVAFVLTLGPTLEETYQSFRIPQRTWGVLLGKLHETVGYWGPAVPLVALCGALLWHNGAGSRHAPWMRFIVANYRRANFADLLALLVAHEVPLHEALILAADAAGDKKIVGGAESIAAGIVSGKSVSESISDRVDWPPFMKWMIGYGAEQGVLAASLRQVGQVYRRRAVVRAEWIKIVLPIAITVGIGGGAALIYGLTLFLPLSDLIRDLFHMSSFSGISPA
jgi:general secretion pathway protein F